MDQICHICPMTQANEIPTEPKFGGLFLWSMLLTVLLGGLLLSF